MSDTNITPLIHIVDDDPSVLQSLRRLLQAWGMQVRTFASGKDFLSAQGELEDVDCAVIDVQMPGMTGLEVQESLSRTGSAVPIIFITAHEEEGIEVKAMRAGAIGFLRKPFSDKALVGLIWTAVQRQHPMETP